MRNRLSLIPLLLVMVVTFAGAPAVANAGFKDVYTDCNDGTVDGKFTAKELQQALQNADAFAGDYSECSDAIFRAQSAQSGGSTGGAGGGSAAGGPATAGGTGPVGGTPAAGGVAGAPGVGQPATTAGAPAVPDPRNDARGADAAEKAAALAAATASADKKAGDEAAELKNLGVPVAALDYGGTTTSLPGPLLLTLLACALAACLAGATTGAQALRRRRGR